MNSLPLTRPQASLELAIWQAEADSVDSSELYIWLRELGLPPEVALRLKELVSFTKQIGGKLISLGKVIVIKLIEFVKQHPNLAAGVALGGIFSSLIASIPFLGPVLAPIALPLGITVGAIAGHRMDMAENGRGNSKINVVEITQEVIEIARAFFQLFIDTILALTDEIKAGAN